MTLLDRITEQSSNDDGTHRLVPNGAGGEILVPRVTHVLNVVAKNYLRAWDRKNVATACWDDETWGLLAGLTDEEAIQWLADAPVRHMQAAGTRGTNVHKACEALLRGETLPALTAEEDLYFASFKRFLDDVQPEVTAVEQRVVSLAVGYTGTFDFRATIKGLGETCVDIKTSKSIAWEYGLQLAAYARAEFWQRGNDLVSPPLTQAAAVLQLRPVSRGKGYTVATMDWTATNRAWEAFRAAHRIFTYESEHRQLTLKVWKPGVTTPTNTTEKDTE